MAETNQTSAQNKGNFLQQYSRYGAIVCALILCAYGLMNAVDSVVVGDPWAIALMGLLLSTIPYLLGCIAMLRNKRSWFWVSTLPYALFAVFCFVVWILAFLLVPGLDTASMFVGGFYELFSVLLPWLFFCILALRARKNVSFGPAVGKEIWYFPFILFLFNFFLGASPGAESIISAPYILLSSYWLTHPVGAVAKKESKYYPGAAQEVNAAVALQNYKNLLESGVITQEEFEAKKKQLLNL